MHRIIFTGAQCTGKTAILNFYKEAGYNVITEVVRNLAKKGVKINEDGDEKGQTKIFNEYKKLLGVFDVNGYISDRGLIDVTAYTMYLRDHGKISSNLADKQIKQLMKFREQNPDITYCYFPIEFDIVDDGVRSLDEQFRADVDRNIKWLLENCGINYIVVKGTIEERIKKVARLMDWLTEGMYLFTSDKEVGDTDSVEQDTNHSSNPE